MFSIGFVELVMVGVVGLLVMGPDRLPGAVREATMWISRIRRHVSELQRQVDEQIEEFENQTEIAELYKGRKLLDDAQRDLKKHLNAPLENTGENTASSEATKAD
ncbi:MAG: Sec-independent protein translocase protein TatB [Halieaceae bacterium]|jgi:sec-independent protein translocase protein TatB|nr:Sec-independent protein translocase protein TatB [Halieaceae bacterium]